MGAVKEFMWEAYEINVPEKEIRLPDPAATQDYVSVGEPALPMAIGIAAKALAGGALATGPAG